MVHDEAQLSVEEVRRAADLHAHTARLPVPSLLSPRNGGFQSFFLGGFECSAHRRRDGRRLDLISSTGHRLHARADYDALAQVGIRTVRDGLHWPTIESSPGRYDWSSLLPLLHAAQDAGTEVIWDLCHWGWPDWLDIWSVDFPDRLARFAAAASRVVSEESDVQPIWLPINEISFWAWGGGSVGYLNPFAECKGDALKIVLARAAIAAARAVRDADPCARLTWAEPAIHIAPRSHSEADIAAARDYTLAQFEALDLVTGRLRPDLGGGPELADVIGVNYYVHNQWVDGGEPLGVRDPRYRPFRHLLGDFAGRYGQPVFVAETGIEGDLRAPWLRMIGSEVAAAQASGTRVDGICLYPVTDYPGWDDDRLCPTGLLGEAGPDGRREVDAEFAHELALQQATMRLVHDEA